MGEAKQKKKAAAQKQAARPIPAQPAETSTSSAWERTTAIARNAYSGIASLGKVRLLLLGLLFIVTIYSAAYASIFIANNSDAVVYPYLFMDGVGGGDMVVPGKHANILKYPLFWLQSVLPYDYHTLMLVNILLVLSTVFIWLFLLMRFTDKKYHNLLIVSLILLLVTSQSFNVEIVYNTVRNIEYPIALAFIIAVGKIVLGQLTRLRAKIFASVAFILLALTIAGDDFFKYVPCAVLLMIIGIYCVRERKITKRALQATGYILGAVIAGEVIRSVCIATGIIALDKGYLSAAKYTELQDLLPTLQLAWDQFVRMMGIGTIDGFDIAYVYLIPTAILMVGGSIGLLVQFLKVFSAKSGERNEQSFFVAISLSAVFFATFFAYVISGLAFVHNAQGDLVSTSSQRYLTAMPLIIGFGLVCLVRIWPLATWQKSLRYLVVGTLVTALIALPMSVRHNQLMAQSANQLRHSFAKVRDQIRDKQIEVIVSGYWYGSTLRLSSGGDIRYVAAARCNDPEIINSHKSWYKPSPDVKRSALVIDMGGPDLSFLGYCPEKDLLRIYGKPAFTLTEFGVKETRYGWRENTKSGVNIWVYDYDIRTKLKPLPKD